MVHPFTDGVSIEVETFKTTCNTGERKLDLLFYNNVNRAGQVLTSLVFNSGVRDAQDTNKLHYEQNKLNRNTDIEMLYNIVGDSKKWSNSAIITLNEDLIKDNSYDADRTAIPFDINTDFSVAKVVGENVYDGWYTVVSVGLTEWEDGDVVPAGVLRYNPTESRAEYYKESGGWEAINKINSTQTIYDLSNTIPYNPYTAEHFIVTTKIHALYTKLLNKDINRQWYSTLNKIGPKLATLENSVDFKNYGTAQLMINSFGTSLLMLLI